MANVVMQGLTLWSRWLFVATILFVFAGSSAWAENAAISQYRDGFIFGSRVNVRAAPDTSAKLIRTMLIGTPVRWKSLDGEWCEISIPSSTTSTGFVVCHLVTDKAPALEQIDAELAAPHLTSAQTNDLLARRFYLSPSLNTIQKARKLKKMPDFDQWESRSDLKRAMLAPDHAFVASLMEAYSGELTGMDFRPVDLRINVNPITDLAKAYHFEAIKVFHSEAEYDDFPEMTLKLPAVRTSLFRSSRDLMVVGWAGPSSERVNSQGVQEVKAGSALSFTSWNDVIEFSKLYPKQRLVANHTPLAHMRHHNETEFGWHNTGGVDVKFIVPLQAVVIFHDRGYGSAHVGPVQKVTRVKLNNVQANLYSYCSSDPVLNQSGEVVVSDPAVFSEAAIVAFAPHVRITSTKRVGSNDFPVLIDLDMDDIPDLAFVVRALPGDMAYGNIYLAFANISGTWRLAYEAPIHYCD